MDSRLDALQQRIGHRFADPALLERALTHRSFGADHNERLEFPGDAVLSLAVSSLLFERLGDSDEGDLTRARAHLVREDSLHRADKSFGDFAPGLKDGLPGVTVYRKGRDAAWCQGAEQATAFVGEGRQQGRVVLAQQ